MSGENSKQNCDLKPRKKPKHKRKANSPLSDNEQRKADNGANNGPSNVSAYNFSNFISSQSQSQSTIPMMNFSQPGPYNQGAPMFGAGAYQTPTQSPT